MNTELSQQYNQWNEKKKILQDRSHTSSFFFNEGDIWWCSAGLNVGKEVFGKGSDFKRPVLVLTKLSEDLCIVLPITSKVKNGTWFCEIDFRQKKRWVMLYQIRLYDKKRFLHKFGEISRPDFLKTKEKLENLLELSSNRHPIFMGVEGTESQSTLSISNADFESIESAFYSLKEAIIAEYLNNPDFA